jgi:predicted O-methyltransferase YrrM
MTFSSGHPAVDRYIADGYETVRGMSSRFAATICGHIIRRQTELGISGHFAEIGTFEGRFFIAMALGLSAGEKALGIDTFDWPNAALIDRFHGHCARFGLTKETYTALKANTKELTSADITKALGGPVRFWHIDGDHSRTSLAVDLDLAHSVMHPQGILCLDDMLHPGYPLMVTGVHAWLEKHPEMRLLAVLDREDIVAAAKFLLCRTDAVALYADDLMTTFRQHHWTMGADFEQYYAVVLTPHPRLAEVE